jgi:putative phosphoesterase
VRLGVISDTHGLLRPEALRALRGSERILHAGDIGGPEILAALRRIAPVTAVRGNNDRGAWAGRLPETRVLRIADTRLFLIHDLHELELDPQAAGIHVVIAGHSHQPRQQRSGGVLYFNPGSAGPRRFRLPVTVGRLIVRDGHVRSRVVDLAPALAAGARLG